MTTFSLDRLDVFERPGATVEKRESRGRAGCWVTFPNGWGVSIQWGAGNYGSNYDAPFEGTPPDATTAEIAVIRPGEHRDMVRWMDGDTVQGWCSMERVQHVIDLVAAGELMREYVPPPEPPEMRADDGWEETRPTELSSASTPAEVDRAE